MNLKLFIIKNIALLSTVLAISSFVFNPGLALAEDTAAFLSGNIMTGGNRTTRVVDWEDPVSAVSGNVIEFRILAQNTVPNTVARNVMVKGELQTSLAQNLVARGIVTADNAGAISDTVTVNLTNGEVQRFDFIEGHTRVFSPGCPNGCDIAGAAILTSGINVGDLAWGESAQVAFKAFVTNFEQPTPTPTRVPTQVPTATPTPTRVPTQVPTATPTPTRPVGVVQECLEGQILAFNGQNFVCINISNNNDNNNNNQNNNDNRINFNPVINNNANQTVTVANPPAPVQIIRQAAAGNVSTLPKTGLPLAVWGLGSLLPVGLGLKKFNRRNHLKDNPNTLWERREFLKEN